MCRWKRPNRQTGVAFSPGSAVNFSTFLGKSFPIDSPMSCAYFLGCVTIKHDGGYVSHAVPCIARCHCSQALKHTI